MVGCIGNRQAGQIGDVLAESEAAVHLEARQGLEAIELRAQGVAAAVELRTIGRRPPVGEVAGTVPLRALVVETVAGLMANYTPMPP